MAAASEGKTVQFHYTGRLDDGTVFDTSAERDPLEVKLGERSVIPGVEAALVGMTPGEDKTVTVSAAEAYGAHRPELVQQVQRDAVPDHVDLTLGNRLAASDTSGRRMELTVVGVDDEKVTLDANHPLAGHDLTFDLTLVKVL